jgi:predicted ATP-dependent endonuclease of OLD family
MKYLLINNIGPLKNIEIQLNKINLLIGPQSTGKSCILKIASFCAWTEKAIELNQSESPFLARETLDHRLITFHNLQGYFNEDSFFSYESDVMKFSFSFRTNTYDFEWKEGRWNYKRNKIAYVVAERNVLSVVPNWFDINLPNNNIRYFLKEWLNAQKSMDSSKGLSILNTGVNYEFDINKETDFIRLTDGKKIKLQNVSSGLQSLIPLCVYAYYVTNGIFKMDMQSVKDQDVTTNLLFQLKNNHPSGEYIYVDGNRIAIASKDLNEIVDSFTKYDHSDIYMEEPEENLFPETQHDLVNWFADLLNRERKHSLFIATHSPYIMSAFNNLIQAGDIIEESPEKRAKVEKIIGGNRAIRYDDVAAFAINNGTIHSLKDDELKLISPSELDTASDNISSVFNQLLQL